MDDIFDSEFFKGNRERLRKLFTGTAPIVVTAYAMVQKIGDETYDFRQDGNFWYLTGIDKPEVVLVMDKGREYLIVPEQDDWIKASEGELEFDQLARRSGIDTILNQKEGWKQLESRIKKVRHVATLSASPSYISVFSMYTNPARAELIKKLKSINAQIELLDLRQHLSRMRMVKQPIEIQALRSAVDITVDSLKQVLKPSRLAKYSFEYEMEADITHGFRRRGASGNSFHPVVVGGARACVLHNVAGNVPLASDELVVIDVGARVSNYSADIARTISLNGKPSKRQQALHRALEQAQDYAYSLLKPGVVILDYEREIEHFMGEKLRELGVIQSIERDIVRRYFPHAMSHYIGIDAHDVGDYEYPIEAGTTLVVEPGIYIPEEGIGVRIEDNVLITDDGYEILSRRLPRGL